MCSLPDHSRALFLTRTPRVCVVGLGHVGLPTAALLADCGHSVTGVDVDPIALRRILNGSSHTAEPGLSALVKRVLASGHLRLSAQPEAADVFVVAVPTPLSPDRAPDRSLVDAAIASLTPHLIHGSLIIIESTCPVGTTATVAMRLRCERPDLSGLCVAYCPERILPGRILHEVVHNDRVIGGVDRDSTDRAAAFFRTFVKGQIATADAATAEMVKLAENAFRDVNIAFANELSMVCHEFGMDASQVIRHANRHPRVNILKPGPGVGGHCVAVDPWFLIAAAPNVTRLMRTAREVNASKTAWVVDRVLDRIQTCHRPVIACLGLTYKPETSDTRESPSLLVTDALRKRSPCEVLAVDPFVPGTTPLDEALRRANVVVALVAHQRFRDIPQDHLADKVILDFVGAFE
jgi:UDP-N-acetyl-D-mannosaminuronic acid dehydrogenase